MGVVDWIIQPVAAASSWFVKPRSPAASISRRANSFRPGVFRATAWAAACDVSTPACAGGGFNSLRAPKPLTGKSRNWPVSSWRMVCIGSGSPREFLGCSFRKPLFYRVPVEQKPPIGFDTWQAASLGFGSKPTEVDPKNSGHLRIGEQLRACGVHARIRPGTEKRCAAFMGKLWESYGAFLAEVAPSKGTPQVCFRRSEPSGVMMTPFFFLPGGGAT